MQNYSRLASPRYRRITLRFSGIEIEFRTSRPVQQEGPSAEERAYRRACAEELISSARIATLNRYRLGW